eukprot:2170701-Alexandrium_andersonii.AAC.1
MPLSRLKKGQSESSKGSQDELMPKNSVAPRARGEQHKVPPSNLLDRLAAVVPLSVEAVSQKAHAKSGLVEAPPDPGEAWAAFVHAED